MGRHDGDGPPAHCVDATSHPVELTCRPLGRTEASVASQQHPLQEKGLPLSRPVTPPAPDSTDQEATARGRLAAGRRGQIRQRGLWT